MGTKSFCEIYIHLVWRTKHSERLLSGDLELFVHQRFREIGRDLELSPLAVNSAWDHVHTYYRWHSSVAVDDAVRELKSRTAVEWNKSIRSGERSGELLKWQVGFGAVSTRKSDFRKVQKYVDTQKKRHRLDKVWNPFERILYDETMAPDVRDDYVTSVSGG